nr:hypothetical protein [uncultured Roseibium sp.]
MSIYVTGNSHVGALAQGFASLESKPDDMKIFALGSGAHELTEFSERQGVQVVMRNPDYAKNLFAQTGLKGVGQNHVWVFVMGSHNSRILRGHFWRNAAPSTLQMEGKRPVSEGLLTAMIEGDQEKIRDFLSDVKRVGARFLVAACPPTRRDRFCDEQGIPVEVLRYVNGRACDAFFQWVTEQEIPLVRPPEECMDENGFLRSEYTKFKTASGSPDPHHANAAYGELMTSQIIKAVRDAYPDAWKLH